MAELKKAGVGDYGIAVSLGDITPRGVAVLIAALQEAIFKAVMTLVNEKEFQAVDRLDMRFFVTKKGSK